jgi:hypothetical protein
MGAASVFETAVDTQMRKSMAKFLTPFFSAGALAKIFLEPTGSPVDFQ